MIIDFIKIIFLKKYIYVSVHMCLLVVVGGETEQRKCAFTQCVINLWNSLLQDVIMASGLDAFKSLGK